VAQRTIPVACIQTSAHDRADFERAWPRILALVAQAAESGAKLIVLPEGTVPGYVLGPQPLEPALLRRAQDDLAECARSAGATIVYGGAKIAGGAIYNAAIVLGPDGSEIGFAAKSFLWHFDRRWFTAGSVLEPIDTPAGRLGVLVCADGRIPTIAATLAERGAEMFVMPTAWVTSGRDPAALENIQADLLVNVRARENGIPFVAANKCGVELESVAYCGKSAIVDAGGKFAGRAGERAETIVCADVTIAPRAARPIAPPAAAPPPPPGRERVRLAFTAVRDPAALQRLAQLALQADADALLAAGEAPGAALEVRDVTRAAGRACDALQVGGVTVTAVGAEFGREPRGLVNARLAGADLFAWTAEEPPEWLVPMARARAVELRAYVLAFAAAGERAFAVDPDGAVIAGTFDGFRVAAFGYDRARAAATTVAPATDVLSGLRAAETVRAAALAAAP
jgi:predicted amidohydrolase